MPGCKEIREMADDFVVVVVGMLLWLLDRKDYRRSMDRDGQRPGMMLSGWLLVYNYQSEFFFFKLM